MANLPEQLVDAGLLDPETTTYPNLDPYCLGVVERFGQPPILCYDKDAVLDHFVAQGMTPEEAEEWFDYNVLGASAGEMTPCFLTRYTATPEEPIDGS